MRARQIDDKGERNLIAPRFVIYLWIELISKPTAENHTDEEVGGVRPPDTDFRNQWFHFSL